MLPTTSIRLVIFKQLSQPISNNKCRCLNPCNNTTIISITSNHHSQSSTPLLSPPNSHFTISSPSSPSLTISLPNLPTTSSPNFTRKVSSNSNPFRTPIIPTTSSKKTGSISKSDASSCISSRKSTTDSKNQNTHVRSA